MSLKAPSLSPRERKIARLKKSLATIENLRQELGIEAGEEGEL